MAREESLGLSDPRSAEKTLLGYDYAKAAFQIAKKNGWDLASLDLVPRDFPVAEGSALTRQQVAERNRLVRGILERFGRLLTPPVPPGLERAILDKDQTGWLPWEREVIQKACSWRDDLKQIRHEIIDELQRCAR